MSSEHRPIFYNNIVDFKIINTTACFWKYLFNLTNQQMLIKVHMWELNKQRNKLVYM